MKPPENWPRPSENGASVSVDAHQKRDLLYAKCVEVGIDMNDKWLSEAAIEAVDKLLDEKRKRK